MLTDPKEIDGHGSWHNILLGHWNICQLAVESESLKVFKRKQGMKKKGGEGKVYQHIFTYF